MMVSGTRMVTAEMEKTRWNQERFFIRCDDESE